jgi:hypothetical protein
VVDDPAKNTSRRFSHLRQESGGKRYAGNTRPFEEPDYVGEAHDEYARELTEQFLEYSGDSCSGACPALIWTF